MFLNFKIVEFITNVCKFHDYIIASGVVIEEFIEY